MKKSVSVKRFIPAPREKVFDTFTMYETYNALPFVLSSKLLQPGQECGSNGVGAVRKIQTPGATLVEKVTACSWPEYWDYKFIEWPLPIPHAGGRMSFTDVPGGTEVNWQTSYDVPDNFAWKFASGGLALGNAVILKLLIWLIGNKAVKQDNDGLRL